MKPRRFSPAVLVLLLAIIGVGVWWFTRSKTAALETVAKVPMPVKAVAPALSKVETPTSNMVETPQPSARRIVAPPPTWSAPATADAPAVSTEAPPAANDPQADLKTAIPDIVRLRRSGDYLEIYKTYTPPDQQDPNIIQTLQRVLARTAKDAAGDTKLQQQLQQIDEAGARAYEVLETQTPTYNETGDEATYMYSLSELTHQPGSYPLTFIKINGKWYEKPPEVKGTISSGN